MKTKKAVTLTILTTLLLTILTTFAISQTVTNIIVVNTNSCSETDGGYNIYQQGSITGNFYLGNITLNGTFQDTCINNNTLIETMCGNNIHPNLSNLAGVAYVDCRRTETLYVRTCTGQVTIPANRLNISQTYYPYDWILVLAADSTTPYYSYASASFILNLSAQTTPCYPNAPTINSSSLTAGVECPSPSTWNNIVGTTTFNTTYYAYSTSPITNLTAEYRYSSQQTTGYVSVPVTGVTCQNSIINGTFGSCQNGRCI